jgi:hypothetical protein
MWDQTTEEEVLILSLALTRMWGQTPEQEVRARAWPKCPECDVLPRPRRPSPGLGARWPSMA